MVKIGKITLNVLKNHVINSRLSQSQYHMSASQSV